MPTVMSIRVFRAWKGYAAVEGRLNKAADAMLSRLVAKQMLSALRYFHDWARRRRFIRKAWHRRGASMRKDCVFRSKITPFQTWLLYTKYRRLVREKMRVQFQAYLSILWKKKSHLRSLSNGERRMLSSSKRGKRVRRPSIAGKVTKKPGSSHGSKSKPGSSNSSRKPGSSRGGSRSSKKRGDSVSSVDSRGSTMNDSDAGDSNTDSEEQTGLFGGKPQAFRWKRNVSHTYDIHSVRVLR
jgi:hypothetical protein